MTLVRHDVLRRASRRNARLRKWLNTWATSVEGAMGWRSLDNLRKMFPSADGVKLKSDLVVTVFNVKGNEYRLLTSIDYDAQTVQVLEVLTHAEYDKDLWKERY